jgi:hypothetical protein
MKIENKKPTIIYIYPGKKNSFIAKDIRLLSSKYELLEYNFNLSNKLMIAFEFFAQKLFLIKHLRTKSIYVIKFGGYWSLIPTVFARIFGKKAIIITGGTDCVSFPEIGYGNFNNSLLRFFTKYSFKLADHIVLLHQSMWETQYNYDNFTNKKQGIKHFIPSLKTSFSVVNNGYDSLQWRKNKEKNILSFITVGSGLENPKNKILKGIDLILEVAPNIPEATFTIIGGEPSSFGEVSSNVRILASVKHEELINFYSQASYYLQLSISEGFPNSLCEAMLCECIPIVSNVSSMPFIVDQCGYVLEKRDSKLLLNLLNTIIAVNPLQKGNEARSRILETFSEVKRRQGLENIIDSISS